MILVARHVLISLANVADRSLLSRRNVFTDSLRSFLISLALRTNGEDDLELDARAEILRFTLLLFLPLLAAESGVVDDELGLDKRLSGVSIETFSLYLVT